MRLLLAVDHEELQDFIMRDTRIESCEVANCAQGLFEIIRHSKADTLVLSKYLNGEVTSREVINHVRNLKPKLRIVYLYGQEDKETNSFIQYLISENIKDFHIGMNISSIELNRLLFKENQFSKPSLIQLLSNRPKTLWYKELDTAVITVYSNCSNGKSHFAWNMASAFEKHGYITSLINLDRGFSANIYFGIESIYDGLLDYFTALGDYKEIINSSYKKGNLNIIAGSLGNEEGLNTEDFLKLLNIVRSKSEIVIIDTYTGIMDTTLQAINHSTVDFLIFDCDLMHFHMNKLMLEKLKDIFVENKTYAIINNCNTASESYKDIYRQIAKLGIKFKGILPLSSCGSLGYDLMATGKTPYDVAKSSSSFCIDMNNIMEALNVRIVDKNKRPIFSRGGR